MTVNSWSITTNDDPRCIDPRWLDLEREDYFGEDGWMTDSLREPGNYGVRAGSREDRYDAVDGVDAVNQAMARYPDEIDFEIESWHR